MTKAERDAIISEILSDDALTYEEKRTLIDHVLGRYGRES